MATESICGLLLNKLAGSDKGFLALKWLQVVT